MNKNKKLTLMDPHQIQRELFDEDNSAQRVVNINNKELEILNSIQFFNYSFLRFIKIFKIFFSLQIFLLSTILILFILKLVIK